MSESSKLSPAAAAEVHAAIAAERDLIFAQLKELVAFDSVHNDPRTAAAQAAAGEWVAKALSDLGLNVTAHPTVDGSTAYLAERPAATGQPTVLLYSHYDIVPTGDPALWTTPPLELTARDCRWYGRGAADCKGNVVMHLAALRYFLANSDSGIGIKVLVEGSEERGGAGLDELIDAHPELFSADAIMIADSGNHELGVPTLTTSLRGGGVVDVTVKTLEFPQHSGGVGGPAPDAVAALVRMLDSLRDSAGAITIDGVDCTADWEGVAYSPEDFAKDATILPGVDILGDPHQIASQLWARPAVTVIGFDSTPIADAVNAVPAVASARLNLRVPVGLDAVDVMDKLHAHLRAHAPWNVHVELNSWDPNQPFATDLTTPAAQLMRDCLSAAYDGKETVYVGTGGSIPLCIKLQENVTGSTGEQPSIILYGVEEPTCAIHSVDESVSPEEIISIATAETMFLLNFGS